MLINWIYPLDILHYVYKKQTLLGWWINLQAKMLSIRFVYFVATITVVIVESYSALDGANELRVAYQAPLFGLTDEQGNEYIEYTFHEIFFAKCFLISVARIRPLLKVSPIFW